MKNKRFVTITVIVLILMMFSACAMDGSDSKASNIKSITDNSVGLVLTDVEEPFYEDYRYKYSFGNPISQHIIVKYKDGTEENVRVALEGGRIQINDLDSYGIRYFAEPKVYIGDNILIDSLSARSVNTDTDDLASFITPSTHDNVAPEKSVTFDGVTYTALYDESNYSEYNTLIDSYEVRDDDGKRYIIFEISREQDILVGVRYVNNYYTDNRSGKMQSRDFYIDAAKQAIAPFIDVSDYNVNFDVPAVYTVNPFYVYFERKIGDFVLTSAYVRLLADGTVFEVHSEKDYDWDSAMQRIGSIDSSMFDEVIEQKLMAAHAEREIPYLGYSIKKQRIAPDKNGKMALHVLVEPISREDNDALFINPLVMGIYVE